MHVVKENYSLKKYNTFGLDCNARYFLEAKQESDILEGVKFAHENKLPVFILGGGSNILLPEKLDQVVIYPNMKNIEVLKEADDYVEVQASAGTDWDKFVAYCVEQNWQGLENLSLIPGNVGASPMQNIGAYGVEVKDFVTFVRFIRLDDLSTQEFSNSECHFGYRNSIFKTELKGRIVITSVCFRLNKKPLYNISYKPLQEIFENKQPTAKDIRKAVIDIRQNKLPNPRELGNAGSFFKNPVITKTQFRFLRDMYPNIPYYEVVDGIKVPAAWLLEKAGWKGYQENDVGCHSTQPLVLVNYGKATYNDLLVFSEKVIKDIKYCFNIKLEREVNVIAE